MHVLLAARDWLYSLLTSSSQLYGQLGATVGTLDYNIYSAQAPAGVNYPVLIYQFVPGGQNDSTQDGGTIVMANPLYLVKVVTRDRDELLGLQLAGLAHDILQDASDSSWNGFQMNCFQTEPFMSQYQEGGKMFCQAGGYYRVRVRPPL